MLHPIDAHELERAWHALRSAAEHFDLVARAEGWPTPFSPIRYLVLAKVDAATRYGLSARRLGHALGLPPSTLAYHLDALEEAGLVARAPWAVHDRRKVAIRLTDEGRYALRRLGRQTRSRSPAIARP